MGKIFNIAGPCNPEDHYMLPATERIPEVMRLVEDKAYFVVHAQRQCGKTTAFRALVDDINAKGERLAMYCSLEVVQKFPDPTDGIPMIYEKIRGEAAVPFKYREAYPQLVLQAFLQRVLNGGGEIVREMALGKKAMDLGVLFRGAKYAIECKKASFYAKSHEKAYDQVCGYMDRLGVNEGWLVVFDPDLSKPWEQKIGLDEIAWKAKQIHLVRC